MLAIPNNTEKLDTTTSFGFLLNFGSHGMIKEMSESFGAGIGKALTPILVPAGLGLWQIVLALFNE